MYEVLRPVYEKTGESSVSKEGTVIQWERVARWVKAGYAESIEDAKAKFTPAAYGYAVVLQEVRH